MDGAFKRIHFFKGFATTAEDWQAAEAYHSEKRRLHNKYFHAPGVIPECLNGLAVTATPDGMALRVESGMALDEEGRELYLPQPVTLDVNVQSHRGATIYLVIAYSESKEKKEYFRPNPFNSEYAGYAFIEEFPAVTITGDPPDNKHQIELARIDLAPDAASIKDPTDPSRPGRNEIDRRFVKRTGQFRAQLEDLAEVVRAGTANISHGGETRILIQNDQPLGEHHFYVASVVPFELISDRRLLNQAAETQGLLWQILARWTQVDLIDYQLQISNSSPVDMQVAYKVYRFR